MMENRTLDGGWLPLMRANTAEDAPCEPIIYAVEAGIANGLTNRLAGLLDDEETAVVDGYRAQPHRDAYVVAHGLLRLILSEYLKVHPKCIRFARNAFGKPELRPSCSTRLTPYFNLTHSADVVCIAVSTIGPVGVDIERIRYIPEATELLRSILTADELSQALAIPDDRIHSRSETLQFVWTMKEAILKAAGYGLHLDPKSVVIELAPIVGFLTKGGAPFAASSMATICDANPSWAGRVSPFRMGQALGAVAAAWSAGALAPCLGEISQHWLSRRLDCIPL